MLRFEIVQTQTSWRENQSNFKSPSEFISFRFSQYSNQRGCVWNSWAIQSVFNTHFQGFKWWSSVRDIIKLRKKLVQRSLYPISRSWLSPYVYVMLLDYSRFACREERAGQKLMENESVKSMALIFLWPKNLTRLLSDTMYSQFWLSAHTHNGRLQANGISELDSPSSRPSCTCCACFILHFSYIKKKSACRDDEWKQKAKSEAGSIRKYLRCHKNTCTAEKIGCCQWTGNLGV